MWHPPVLSIGEVARALVDLQRALARTLALILLHPEHNKSRSKDTLVAKNPTTLPAF